MKTPYRFFFILMLATQIMTGYAQPAKEADIQLRQLAVDEMWPNPVAITLLISQEGMNNQIGATLAGLAHATLQQQGSFNQIFLYQTITRGRVELMQTGESNHYRGTVSGTEIEISILQQGEFNTLEQQVVGEHLMFNIIQEGSHNLIQQQYETPGIPLQIHQRGSDMRLIIRSN